MKNINLHIIQRLKQQPMQSKEPKGLLDQYGEFLDAYKDVDNSTIAGLLKIQNVIAETSNIVQTLTANTGKLEEANKSLQDQFGLNIKDSTRMGANLDTLAKSFGVGGGKMRQYAASLKSLVGGYAGAFSMTNDQALKLQERLKPMLGTQKIIQNQLKLSGDLANSFIAYSANVGQNSEDMLANYAAMAEKISDATGYQVSAKELVADISGLSEDILMHYGKMPNKLAMATVKAKALGVTMSQLNNIGNNLLNIESSIGQELEYQLLSGRRLVGNQQASAELRGKSLTNAYREAQLQGEGEKQAEILNQILKQEGATLNKNLFARKQMAQMLGMDEAALAKSLMKQETLNELQAKGIMDFDVKSIMNSKLSEEDKKTYLKKLQDVSDTRTTDERMADDIESIVTDGIQVLTKPEDIAKAAAARSERLRKEGIEVAEEAKTGATAQGTSTMGQTVTQGRGITSTVDFGKQFLNSLASTTLKTPWEIQTTGDITIAGNTTSVKDIAFGPAPGRVIMGPEGAFSLDNKDSIIAGTNLGGGSSPDIAAFTAAIVSAIKQQTDALTSNSGINAPYWS